MEKVGELLHQGDSVQQNRHTKTTCGPQVDPSNFEKRAIVRLWAKMIDMFGSRFASQYGRALDDAGNLTPTAHTWFLALREFGADGIRRGLERTVAAGGDWPPTLPQFRDYCRPVISRAHNFAPRELPEPDDVKKARHARGHSAIERLRAGMRTKKTEEQRQDWLEHLRALQKTDGNTQ